MTYNRTYNVILFPHRGADDGHTVETLGLYVFQKHVNVAWKVSVLARRSACICLSVIVYNGSSVCAH